MVNPNHIINLRETAQQFSLNIKKPSNRYLDELFRLKSAPELMPLFPNAKEWTESSAAFHAARGLAHLGDPDVVVICVGDGATPRTAAMFALRSRWTCVSVDPRLRPKEYGFRRLELFRGRVEEMNFFSAGTMIIAGVHSHARLENCLEHIHGETRHVIAIPCCVPQETGRDPDEEYTDWGIHSPKRLVRIWRNI